MTDNIEQEPVAWMDLHKELGKLRWMGGDEGWDNAINAVRDRLIELSAPVRTKDLTDEEIEDVCCRLWSGGWRKKAMNDFARAVIEKFKEKNK